MKKFFEEPEIEVVRFNARDLIITASKGCTGDVCTGDETTDEGGNASGCEGYGCTGTADDED